jgi:hypothetical protein
VPRAEESPSVPPAAPTSRRGLVWGLIAAAAVALLVGGSVVTVNLLNAGPPKPKPTAAKTADPQDPLGDMTASPKDVAGAPDGTGSVRFTWTNPSPKTGDSYLVTVVTLSGDGETTKVETPEITIPAQPGGKTCIDVVLRRENGSASSTVRGCTP